ncbi:MAG TPA: methyltransferase domain-containing protein [Gemmatimonadaceae bacterium]
MTGWLSRMLAPALPVLRRWRRPATFADMDTAPLSTEWGFDRGTPIDRYYIERFLESHATDIRGRVLEVKNADYTQRYGRGVTRADVLDVSTTNPLATLVADLSQPEQLPEGQFDCFVLTQTMQFIYEAQAVVASAHRLLAPGGVLLVTVPSISRIAPRYGPTAEFWRFTAASCARLFGDVFGSGNVEVRTHGNVLAATAFLYGATVEEIPREKLDVNDPFFPLIISLRAVRAR